MREFHGVSIACGRGDVPDVQCRVPFRPGRERRATSTGASCWPALHFETRGREWACWVCEDWMDAAYPPPLAAVVSERHGLRHSVDLPGMMAERDAPGPAAPAHARDAARIEPRTRDAFCAIGSVCFHVPIQWFREVFDSDRCGRDLRPMSAYVNGEPVSTAAIVMGAGVIGVYNVATLPANQRPRLRRGGDAPRRHPGPAPDPG